MLRHRHDDLAYHQSFAGKAVQVYFRWQKIGFLGKILVFPSLR